MQPEILLEQPSPYGNIFAVVEDFGNCIYFTLYGPENIIPLGEDSNRWIPMRSCWVCNTVPVPNTDAFEMNKIMQTMNQGTPSTMPGKYCRHAAQGLKLDKDQLEVVWFEEGDCAALLYQGEIMVVIPPWATPSISDYVGFAKEFQGELFLGVGSMDKIFPEIEERVKRARAFWITWTQPGTWGIFLDSHMKILEQKFGKHQRYFAIDGGGFPPKALVIFEKEKSVIFITIGMSIFAQPRVELYNENPENFRRVELGMEVDKEVIKEVGVEKIGQFMSKMAAMPWSQLCWLGQGHTLATELFKSMGCNQIIVVDKALNSVVLPHYQGDPVKLLWLVPTTDQELAYQQESRSENLISTQNPF